MLRFLPHVIRAYQLSSLLGALATRLPFLRFVTISLPLGLAIDFALRGVSRHFVALRAVIPKDYEPLFQTYAKQFVAAFGVQALATFQTLARTLSVFAHSMLASAGFVALKFIAPILGALKYPFVLLSFYYLDLYPTFTAAIGHFAPSLAGDAAAIWNVTWGVLYALTALVMVRVALTCLSLLNQIRLTVSLVSSSIQSAIMGSMTKPPQPKLLNLWELKPLTIKTSKKK